MRVHSHRNHRGLAQRIAARMVAVSAVRRRNGSRSGCRECKLAASVPRARRDRSRANFARVRSQGKRTSGLVRSDIETKRNARDIF